MDIGLAKTFLEIMASGTFIEAARKLNLTQTAITTRIKNLESQLNCKLFIRNRSGAKLTREGEVFAKYALTLVQTWETAQSQLQLPVNQSKSIHIGADISLWNPLMTHWLEEITNSHADYNIHSEVDHTNKLVEQLQAGSLDAIVVHQPNYFSGLVVEQVVEEKLIHVQSTVSATPNLFVDWGREFKDNFDSVLPVPRQAALSFSLGPLALKYMLNQGGNGYFRTRVVEPHIQSGKLEKISNSPEFSYPIYVIYRSDNSAESLQNILNCLKKCLTTNTPWLV
ncbi:LysR family transcriptional regulator [Psychrosphaera sp. F3M07]|uniref:LysR family transcriptional regulator n=1 Tax=Psychrosphaera sp. F3M07 TaxID=2841560 RepID=UPI001C09A6A7|nr:LysR family transcriptional regulator [Psychrosphaera sp. F3M07]MBU2916363.1 LysR family transcriptional regulator [Psychrosphaera sp. F3M07]